MDFPRRGERHADVRRLSDPVVGQRVSANCGGGTTTTDANGNYAFSLNRGMCVITPDTTKGEKSYPASRTVTIVGHLVKHVDFKINAPLEVTITASNVTGRAGLAIFKNFSTTEAESKAFFTLPGSLDCQSGCWNVLATVTDRRTGARIQGATVNSSVEPLPYQRSQIAASSDYLCESVLAAYCGTHLLLKTDHNGQVDLFYWSPAVVGKYEAKIKATAYFSGRHGSGKTNVTVKPYLIYAKTGELTEDQTIELAGWYGGKSLLAKFGAVTKWLNLTEKTLGFSTNVLIEAEIAAEKAEEVLALTEKAVTIIKAGEAVLAGLEARERLGFIAMLLDKPALDLSPIGLGDDPSESFVQGVMNYSFEDLLAKPQILLPFHIGAGGLLWDYSKRLTYLAEHHDPAFGPGQTLKLSVYEITTCDEGHTCLPGYRPNISSIKTRLFFDLHAYGGPADSFGKAKLSSFTYTMVVPYDPNAWTEAQDNLAGLL